MCTLTNQQLLYVMWITKTRSVSSFGPVFVASVLVFWGLMSIVLIIMNISFIMSFAFRQKNVNIDEKGHGGRRARHGNFEKEQKTSKEAGK